ncbi:MAG: PH domain-containing protein, partial [Halanaerobiales bacterium]
LAFIICSLFNLAILVLILSVVFEGIFNGSDISEEISSIIPLIILFSPAVYFMGKWILQCKLTRLKITDNKVLYQHGILRRNHQEIKIQRVQNIEITSSLLQRLFSVGDIFITCAGTGGIDIIARGFLHPHKISEILNKAIRQKEEELGKSENKTLIINDAGKIEEKMNPNQDDGVQQIENK